jgi:Ricin-type beta-trefoil lectin domain
MRPGRVLAGFALALTLVLVAPTAVSALWSSRGSASASVTAGSVRFAQSGFEALAAVFGSTEASQVTTRPVTVSNTGTVPAGFTLQLGAESSTDLARAITVAVWRVDRSGDCTAAAYVPPGATAVGWPAVPALTESLAPSAAAVYCVRAAVSAADVTAYPGQSMAATLRLTAAAGAWTHETAARAIQSVAAAPGGWTVSPMPKPIEPVDYGQPGEPMPAPIEPVWSPSDPTTDPASSVSESTTDPAAASLFSIVSAGTSWCATDDGGEAGASTSALAARQCDGLPGQSWVLATDEDGYHRIGSASDPSRTWTADGTHVRVAQASGAATQAWELRSNPDDSTTLVSRADGACLTAAPGPAGDELSRPLVLAACDGSAAQAFTLAVPA